MSSASSLLTSQRTRASCAVGFLDPPNVRTTKMEVELSEVLIDPQLEAEGFHRRWKQS